MMFSRISHRIDKLRLTQHIDFIYRTVMSDNKTLSKRKGYERYLAHAH